MPATLEKIHEALGPDSPFTGAEKSVIKWQYGQYGDFYMSLWDAIRKADETNLRRLELGFPVEVAGFRAWAYGDLGERLRAWGLRV